MPNYKNPPIREAIIEIKFESNQDFLISTIPQLVKEYEESKGLEISGDCRRFNYTSQSNKTTTETKLTGYMLTDKKKFNLRIELDSLAYMFLGKYDGWKNFYGQFSSYWDDLTKALSPQLRKDMIIKRIGVRFINQIELPIDKFQQSAKYIQTNFLFDIEQHNSPKERVEEMLKRKVVVFDKYQGIILETMQYNQNKQIEYLLDIDVAKKFDTNHQPSLDICQILEKLRSLKNQIFESHITKETRQLINND